MNFSNEESAIVLEEWDTSEVDSFAERQSQSFFFLFRRLSMKAFEDEGNVYFNGIKLEDKEDNWLD